jgi:hypothetical protein
MSLAGFCEDEDIHEKDKETNEDVMTNLEDEISNNDCISSPVDILFLVDMSASMYNEIYEVTDAINFFTMQYKEKDILWGMIAGPLNAGVTPGNKNYLSIISNLKNSDEFKKESQAILSYTLSSQYEMLYDALYLSIRNLSLFLPYENDNLLWPTWIGNVFAESVPKIEEFVIDWRKKSKKVIVILTNEIGQSFLFPESQKGKSYNTKNTITKSKLALMLQTIDTLKIYTFTDISSKTGESGWSDFSILTNGKWYDLHDGNITFNLSTIVQENNCP